MLVRPFMSTIVSARVRYKSYSVKPTEAYSAPARSEYEPDRDQGCTQRMDAAQAFGHQGFAQAPALVSRVRAYWLKGRSAGHGVVPQVQKAAISPSGATATRSRSRR